MQLKFWRRLVAVLALVLGIGVAAPATGASAAPAGPVATPTAPTVSTNAINDWWW
jgi:hypothetical protein